MKKLFIPLILIIALLSACAPEIVQNGGKVVHGTPVPSAHLIEAYAGETIVYITKTGTKYHREDCQHLSMSKIPISIEQARQQGIEPCRDCSPPA